MSTDSRMRAAELAPHARGSRESRSSKQGSGSSQFRTAAL